MSRWNSETGSISQANRGGEFSAITPGLRSDIASVDALMLERSVTESTGRIRAIATYLFGGSGFRIRSALAATAARLFGYAGENHIKLGAAVEFIHIAALLHDNVEDEGDRRSGTRIPTLLGDNPSSILAGDFFIARSFQLMVETGSLPALTILSKASATITEAEVVHSSLGAKLNVGESAYLRIARAKSAALFSAAAMAGAALAGADTPKRNSLGRFGESLGVRSMLLQEVAEYEPGVPTGATDANRLHRFKATLPAIIAFSMGTGDERNFWVRVIESGNQREGDFERAVQTLGKYGIVEKLRRDARREGERALAEIENLPRNPTADFMVELAQSNSYTSG